MTGPTSQAGSNSWQRDDGIDGGDRVLRVVKTGSHLTRLADGSFGLSEQLWTSQQGGCSTELQSLYRADEHSEAARVDANNGIGSVSVAVSEVRETMNRLDGNKKGIEPLDVAYTPIPANEPFGPNPYHSDIFPKLGNPGRKMLYSKQKPEVSVDQKKAAEMYAARHGLKL